MLFECRTRPVDLHTGGLGGMFRLHQLAPGSVGGFAGGSGVGLRFRKG